MGKVPFWVYKFVSVIIKKGGYPLLLGVIALVTQGTIKSAKDLNGFINKR